MISEFTVPWVASGSKHGHDLALEWIDAESETVAAAGWSTLSSLVATKADEDLDLDEIQAILKRVTRSIHQQPNRVRHTMNAFVISVGCYVEPLTSAAKATAIKVGKVAVNMGGTACKVPFALDYIQKAEDRGTLGKKRKTAKC